MLPANICIAERFAGKIITCYDITLFTQYSLAIVEVPWFKLEGSLLVPCARLNANFGFWHGDTITTHSSGEIMDRCGQSYKYILANVLMK